jgi:hypothetical protein
MNLERSAQAQLSRLRPTIREAFSPSDITLRIKFPAGATRGQVANLPEMGRSDQGRSCFPKHQGCRHNSLDRSRRVRICY